MVDRRDDFKGPQIHVVYLSPADSPKDRIDVDGTLQCSVAAVNEWMASQGGLEWRIDTYTSGTVELVDITYIRSKKSGSQVTGAERVAAELAAYGLDDPSKRYLTYVASDGGLKCGDARLNRLGLHRIADEFDGRYAQVYIDTRLCRPRDFGTPGAGGYVEMVAAHELIHLDGMVPVGAPHACPTSLPFPSHVCNVALMAAGQPDAEEIDVMYPGGLLPLHERVLDRGHDDYFRHSMPGIPDLANSEFLRSASP